MARKKLTRMEARKLLWMNGIFRKPNAKPLSKKRRKQLARARKQITGDHQKRTKAQIVASLT